MITLGCSRTPASKPTAFRSILTLQTVAAATRLQALDRGYPDIVYQATMTTGDIPEGTGGVEDQPQLLNFSFPKLSAADFAVVKATYGGGRSHLIYREGAAYLLSDFLPPLASAMFGKNFLAEYNVQDKQALRFLQANCWGTVYEFERRSDEVLDLIFTPDWQSYIAALTGGGNGALLPQADPHAPDNPGAKYGDVLLAYDAGILVHTAVYIDSGVWFERTGSSPQFAYRFTASPNSWGDEEQTTYRSIAMAKDVKLPPPAAIFHSITYNCTTKATGSGQLYERQVAIALDAFGAASLTPEAFKAAPGVVPLPDRRSPFFPTLCSE